MIHTVTITDTNEKYTCRGKQHLLAGMIQLARKGIPVGCRSGGCGVCKVKIISGDYQTKIMSREHVTEPEEEEGVVLACRVFPLSDISLQVVGHLNKAVTRNQMKNS